MKKQIPGGAKPRNWGPDHSAQDHVNNPFDSAYIGGHELNHSWKNPVPNESGVNHSYMHPMPRPASSTMSLGRQNKTVAGPMRSGKNPK